MIPNPWLIVGLLVAWIASIVAVGGWQHDAGVTAERARNQGVQIADLKVANAKIKALEEAARANEAKHATEVAAIGAAHEADIETRRVQAEHDVAAVRAGALRLRDPGAKPAACPGAVPSAAPAASVGDGPAPGELSRELDEFLVSEANRADAVAIQLGACQAVVLSDRKEAAP